MADSAQMLKEMQAQGAFFIGIDSDGCVFDSMEIKHKECFCPSFIDHMNLQPVSKYARETWEFVNLYSKTRGVNRFLGLIRSLDLLAKRPEVLARGVTAPSMKGLRDWIERESKLANAALEQEASRTGDADLKTALAWSAEVNDSVKRMVRNVPPFPGVRDSLERMRGKADVIVVSQTPCEALEREWKENRIDSYVRLIAGQEMGSKTEHIAFAAGEKYEPEKVLMIGDAPGDLAAAKANNALFFPINPGREEDSWQEFATAGLDRFFAGSFAGEYEEKLIGAFHDCLPEKAPWQR
jgi:phosphoglycolate phosphatase-like HAD superfamily hydrolase